MLAPRWVMLAINLLSPPTPPTHTKQVGARLPGLRLLLCTCPHTVTALQGTAAKREALTPRRVAAYDAALRALPAATWRRLGVAALSRACGDACSADGVHPQPVVFDALMQVMLGMLGV